MPYKTAMVSIVGSSNPNRSKSVTQERTLNMYPEGTITGSYPSTLLPWPGSKAFSNPSFNGSPRGVYYTSTGSLYKVADTSLYSVPSSGEEVYVGEISGDDDVVMADDGVNLLICITEKVFS